MRGDERQEQLRDHNSGPKCQGLIRTVKLRKRSREKNQKVGETEVLELIWRSSEGGGAFYIAAVPGLGTGWMSEKKKYIYDKISSLVLGWFWGKL